MPQLRPNLIAMADEVIEYHLDRLPLRVHAVWKRFLSPKNCTQPGAMGPDATVWAYFCCIEFGV